MEYIRIPGQSVHAVQVEFIFLARYPREINVTAMYLVHDVIPAMDIM